MTEHMKVKKKLQSIPLKADFNDLIERTMLSDKEKQMMRMYYVENKDFGYIADIMGYTQAGIAKMHKRVLHKIESLL